MNRLRPAVEDRFLCEFVSTETLGSFTVEMRKSLQIELARASDPVDELWEVVCKAQEDLGHAGTQPQLRPSLTKVAKPQKASGAPTHTPKQPYGGPDVSTPGHKLAAHHVLAEHFGGASGEYTRLRGELGPTAPETIRAKVQGVKHEVEAHKLEAQGVVATPQHHKDLSEHLKQRWGDKEETDYPVKTTVRAGEFRWRHDQRAGVAKQPSQLFPRSSIKTDSPARVQRIRQMASAKVPSGPAKQVPGPREEDPGSGVSSGSSAPKTKVTVPPPAVRPTVVTAAPDRGTAVGKRSIGKSFSLLKSWNAINALSRLTL